MADLTFVDESGTPYAGTDPQFAPTTILNYHPVIIDLQKDPGENRLEGEVWVENALVALFDTNNSPVFEFLQVENEPTNNNVFIQPGDVITGIITDIDGNAVQNITQDLQTDRVDDAELNVTNEISTARFANKTNILEFKNEFNIFQFDFYQKIDDVVNLDLASGLAGYQGGYGSYTDVNFGYGTPQSEQDLSLARRITDIREWLAF